MNITYFIHDVNLDLSSYGAKVEIDFKTASQTLINLSINEDKEDPYFIGFENEVGCIQFMRFEKGLLDFDAPVLEDDDYKYSFTKDNITNEEALKILEFFFEGKNWMELHDFEKTYPEDEDENNNNNE